MEQKAQKKPLRTEYIAMALLCVLIAVFVVILIVVSSYKNSNGNESSELVSDDISGQTSSESSEMIDESSEEESRNTVGTIQVASSGKNEGLLALSKASDGSTAVAAPSDLVRLSTVNSEVRLSGTSVEMRKEAAEAFSSLYNAFATAKGKTNIMVDKGYVSYDMLTDKKSQLDLMWGNSLILSVYPADTDGDTLGSGKFAWIPDNCTSYGFIQRYPAEKADITGVEGNQRVYRYVGYAHAAYMGKYHLCLEEYLSQIKNTSIDNPIEFSYNNSVGDEIQCSVYYCAASAENTSKVTVPEGANYAISGNGTDGFIVTIYK